MADDNISDNERQIYETMEAVATEINLTARPKVDFSVT